jgi:uncharacterized damage-inducible protein DinB
VRDALVHIVGAEWRWLTHLANHSTCHRAQVALMMRQLAAEPLAPDFAMFLMEGRQELRVPIYGT